MKAIYIVFAFVLMLSLVSSASLSPATQNECKVLEQTCTNCTFVNITKMKYGNDTVVNNLNWAMTKIGVNYNYTFCGTQSIGEYTYTTLGNPDGTTTCNTCSEEVSFEVTPSGSVNTTNGAIIIIGSLMVMLIVSTIFLIFGYKLENIVAKMSFYSFSVIGFTMVILYTVITIQQILYGFDSIVNGVETFWFVFRIGLTIGAVAFFIIIGLILLKAWKIKRGMIDA